MKIATGIILASVFVISSVSAVDLKISTTYPSCGTGLKSYAEKCSPVNRNSTTFTLTPPSGPVMNYNSSIELNLTFVFSTDCIESITASASGSNINSHPYLNLYRFDLPNGISSVTLNYDKCKTDELQHIGISYNGPSQ